MTRFTANDFERANEAWGANCAPGAVAAILGLTLDEVRPLFAAAGFADKRYTNPTMMYDVLRASLRWFRSRRTSSSEALFWPSYGLARIQWEGRWTQPGVPARAAYRYTHWVGACVPGDGRIGIFDVNAMRATAAGDGWVAVDDWNRGIVPAILEDYKGANGRWHITHAIEVRR